MVVFKLHFLPLFMQLTLIIIKCLEKLTLRCGLSPLQAIQLLIKCLCFIYFYQHLSLTEQTPPEVHMT